MISIKPIYQSADPLGGQKDANRPRFSDTVHWINIPKISLTLAHAITAVILLICAAWGTAASIYAVPGITTVALAAALLSIMAWYFMMIQRTDVARIIWLVTGTFGAVMATLLLSPEVQPQWLFLIVAGVPFLIFSWSEESLAIIVSVITIMLSWALARLIVENGVITPTITGDPLVRSGLFVTVSAVVIAQMATFGFLNHRYHRDMRRSEEEARVAARVREEFLGAVSHEIRLPLNGLVGMMDVLQEGGSLPAEARTALDVMHSCADNLSGMIENILSLNHLQTNRIEADFQNFSLAESCEMVGDLLRSHARAENVELVLNYPPDLPVQVTGDRQRLQQIIMNVGLNAIRFSGHDVHRESGVVDISIDYEHGRGLRVRVSDNGIGMDSATQRQIFQPFFRGNATTRKNSRGLGLGLTFVAEMIKSIGGEIHVKSVPGAGTSVSMRIPLITHCEPIERAQFTGKRVVFVGVNATTRRALIPHLEARDIAYSIIDDVALGRNVFRRGDSNSVFVFESPAQSSEAYSNLLRKIALFPDIQAIWLGDPIRSDLLRGITLPSVAANPVLPTKFVECLRSVFDASAHLEAIDASEKVDAIEKPAEVKPNEAGNGTRLNILVAEDDPISRDVLGRLLEQLGHNATLAENGLEAFERYKTTDFDAILTDCQMPRMSGRELVSVIRLDEAQKDEAPVPVIAISASANQEECKKCLSAGMTAVLAKPIRKQMLIDMLKTHVV